MKKILALTLTSILVMGGTGAAVATAATEKPAISPAAQTEVRATEQNNLYLVPGTYKSEGATVENSVGSGAEKLSREQCEGIFTPNAYLCTLSKGDALPKPASQREGYTFNGWWTIVDATVTYFETVPEISETTFLYADWRADLSQRKDPIIPDESTAAQLNYYMSIERASGETEKIPLYISGTDASTAFDFGYGQPVQLYNEWFELNPDDVITFYTTGLDDTEEPQVSPIAVKNSSPLIQLEASTSEKNDTKDHLEKATTNDKVTCIAAKSRHYRIYVKFYDSGATMNIYMQPKD